MDKCANGDYIISGRYTSAIYRVSGADGSILWRLGGKNSSFEYLNEFNFSSQHDSKIYSENETTTVISIFDNASDDLDRRNVTAAASSGKLIALETSTVPMTARLIKQFNRPDGEFTRLRGKTQMLPNGGAFMGWAAQGYLSEHTPDGRVVLEAEWLSERFNTYRTYKFNFTGSPTELPALRTYGYGSSFANLVSVSYVSWNGATEVAKWNFYGSKNDTAEFHLMGSEARSGFETSFMSSTYQPWTFAEAISAEGEVLGRSEAQQTILPNRLDSVLSEIPALKSESTAEFLGSTSAPSNQLEKTSGFGPLVVLLIAVDLVFAAIGMVGMASFMWKRRAWLPRGIYAPIANSHTPDGDEMSDLSFDEQEVEK